MSRISPLEPGSLTSTQTADYEKLVQRNHATNMQRTLIRDHATYIAYDAWHLSWDSLVDVVGERTAIVFAHAVSEASECQLCSLYFVADLRQLDLDPHDFEQTDVEQLLVAFARAIVTTPTAVPDSLFTALRDHFTDNQIVAIVGFAGQMIATNTFNSVLGVDLDGRLLPLRNDFPSTHSR